MSQTKPNLLAIYAVIVAPMPLHR